MTESLQVWRGEKSKDKKIQSIKEFLIKVCELLPDDLSIDIVRARYDEYFDEKENENNLDLPERVRFGVARCFSE